MKVLTTREQLRRWRRRQGARSVGFVPTMGALHDAHLTLVARALAENDVAVASIFVNPKQFDGRGDLAAYPRALERDAELLESEGCHALWAPTVGEMYPPGFQTTVSVGAIAGPLEGASRPGHFDGVATVVLKLLHQVDPDRAYFGEKDFQQLRVVETLVRDLDLPVEVVRCATRRDADGLAMSSRNRRLDREQRAAALVIPEALASAARAWELGEREPAVLRALVERHLAEAPSVDLEYVSVADPGSLEELSTPVAAALVSLAARVGEVRLIDNTLLSSGATPSGIPIREAS